MEMPENVTDEQLEYLDELRESGITNMYGAGEFLVRRYDITLTESHDILEYWMKSFDERHQN